MLTRLRTWTRQLRSSQDNKPVSPETDTLCADQADLSVLLVCMGNICRSPLAEGVLRRRVADELAVYRIFVDSAGTHSYHAGSPPDPRARAAASRRGYGIDDLRARRVEAADFELFDLLLAMDRENLAYLHEIAPSGLEHKARLFLDFTPRLAGGDVPDPYYGGATGFERVLDMVEEAADGLLAELAQRLVGPKSPAG